MTHAAMALTCSHASWTIREINDDTKSSIEELRIFFSDARLDEDFVEKRNKILIEFPESDQWLVTDLFYINICRLISISEIDPDKRYASLIKHRPRLYRRVQSRRVATTRRQGKEIASGLQLLASKTDPAVSGDGHIRIDFAFGSAIGTDQPEGAVAESGDTVFLRNPPFVVTRANKHFVIVASVQSREGAISTMKHLKQKAPQFDFEVYAPRESNAHYAIIMATWVPKNVALQALGLARQYVARDSYIWACPDEGTSC